MAELIFYLLQKVNIKTLFLPVNTLIIDMWLKFVQEQIIWNTLLIA